LFEVVHAYRRLSDSEGVPGIYYTPFAPGIESSAAAHELLNYEHGQYPFVHFKREHRSPWFGDSRGYGEIGSTWQAQLKAEWDSRTDRASVTTLPPFFHPPGEAPSKWGPGVKVPTHRPGSYGFFAAPEYDRASRDVETSVREFADMYFGRPVNEMNAPLAVVTRQHLANAWMRGWAKADTQMLQLCQQFEDEEFYFRVVGSSQGKSIRASREEIQGKFDLTIGFNVQDLDPEYVKEKLDLIKIALEMDFSGAVDRDEALAAVFELLDPNLGERLLKPAEGASQQEIEDEQAVFAKLFAGVPVDVKPGQAYELRLKVLQNILATNPPAQQRFEQDEYFREIVEKRAKQLGHQLQQRQNAVIGRLGA
jgi:hypothetical protein